MKKEEFIKKYCNVCKNRNTDFCKITKDFEGNSKCVEFEKMSADDMFLALEFDVINKKDMLYIKKSETEQFAIYFNSINKCVCCQKSYFLITNDEKKWYEKTEKKVWGDDFEKYSAFWGHWQEGMAETPMEYVQAINEKVNELGWI